MKKFELGIFAETLITVAGGEVKEEHQKFVGINNGKIAEISPWKKTKQKDCKRFLDGTGKICLPGLVNGHTHLAMTLFRGLEDDVPFHTWLFERILPLENQMVNRDFVKIGTQLAALECIRLGTTTVNEMYFYTGEAAKALDEAGLRGIVSQAMAKFPLPEDKDLGTDKIGVFNQLHKKFAKNGRVEIGLGPHAPYSCTDEMLKNIAKVSQETGAPIHIHVSETKKEVDDSYKEFGMSPVARLKKLGVLNRRTLCAHCVHLNEDDQSIMRETRASVLYNPDSNMKLGSGIAPVANYIKNGTYVAFGTDGSASNNNLSLFGAMNIGTKLQKLANGDNTAMIAKQAIYTATLGGAAALGLDQKTGSI